MTDEERDQIRDPRISNPGVGPRVSYGFGESVINHGSLKKRRGTHNSGGKYSSKSGYNMLHEHSSRATLIRKNTLLKNKK